jgi:hypothetical protein
MMVFDPSRRPTAAELLRDPYFRILQTKPSHDGHESGELPDACAAASRPLLLNLTVPSERECGEEQDFHINRALHQ